LSEWGNRQSWEYEGGVAPAGRPMPAGPTTTVPPQFIVYKRRLYVLARKAPVLDHRQASIDSIFEKGEAPKPTPFHQVNPQGRTVNNAPASRRTLPFGHQPVRTDRRTRHRVIPSFVPRSV
jgi:hypothetical protein